MTAIGTHDAAARGMAMALVGEPERTSFEAFFEGMYRPLVGQAYALTGDFGDAQDLAQEALCRAWRSWSRVSRLDSPEAWTRKVLHNLAVSRWRRLQLRRGHDAKVRPALVASGPEPEYVDVLRAVAKLPSGQRRALVLREVVGLSGEEIAAEMGVPPGTVRGWLSRARHTVAAECGWEEDHG